MNVNAQHENVSKPDDIEAMLAAADEIVWGDETRPVDPALLDKAIDYYTRAANAGNTDAMTSYGAMFYVGRGVEQDYQQAMYWYTKAANLGSSTAMSNLGYCYYYGQAIPVDMEMAYKMFSKAAVLGDYAAYYKVGDMYQRGEYVEKDEGTAFRLYASLLLRLEDEKPMNAYPDVCSRLGHCYHHGLGVKKDLEMAWKFLADAKLYFKKRIDAGYTLTDGVFKRAAEELHEVLIEVDEMTVPVEE